MFVLDTHTVIWWVSAPQHLGKGASRALARSDSFVIPAIVFWEIAMLARRRRIATLPSGWAPTVMSIPGVEVAPLDHEVALTAAELEMHGDPADRFIVATALTVGAPLVTKDERIRSLTVIETVW